PSASGCWKWCKAAARSPRLRCTAADMLRALVLCLGFALPAAAQPAVTVEDLAEIRAVINRQIDAFRRDDAHEAFALVSPGVQQSFGTPEHFLEAVRASYHAMYRPAAVTFLGLTAIGHDAVQPVRITDRSRP